MDGVLVSSVRIPLGRTHVQQRARARPGGPVPPITRAPAASDPGGAAATLRGRSGTEDRGASRRGPPPAFPAARRVAFPPPPRCDALLRSLPSILLMSILAPGSMLFLLTLSSGSRGRPTISNLPPALWPLTLHLPRFRRIHVVSQVGLLQFSTTFLRFACLRFTHAC